MSSHIGTVALLRLEALRRRVLRCWSQRSTLQRPQLSENGPSSHSTTVHCTRLSVGMPRPRPVMTASMPTTISDSGTKLGSSMACVA
eukprot:scaffold16107_cov67-Phaeocystis_antarctica.AAC.8